MKALKSLQYLALVVILFISNACKKEPPPPRPTFSLDVTQFLVSAGTDTAITNPVSSVLLKGNTSLVVFNIETKKWTKKSGPAGDTIENPNEFVTTVRNLQVGVYEYEFTVKSKNGITKSDVCKIIVNSIPPPPPPPGNRPPSAYSGYDYIIHWPKDTGYLYGGVYDPDNNIATIRWTKVAGPLSSNIARPDSVFTRITNLEKGVYKFEIKVVDSLGLTARDTNTVIVGEMPANPQEIILTNQPWACHWDCYVQIDRLYNTIPPDRVFKVFIKRDNSINWIEVAPIDEMLPSSIYGYSLRKGTLWIHYTEFDISDTPDIKIVY